MNKFWNFKNQADDPSVGELFIFGDIANETWWGDEVTPKQFVEDLQALGDIGTLKVFINSPGGDAFAGQTIHSILRRHPAKVHVHIDGLAASAASIIAVAGDTVTMPTNSMMMIHDAWTIAMGDANEFRKVVEMLDKVKEAIVAAYQHKTDLSAEEISDLMTAVTWMTAEDAVSMGFADEVEELEVAASVKGDILTMNGIEMDMSKYSHLDKVAASLGDRGDVHKLGKLDLTINKHSPAANTPEPPKAEEVEGDEISLAMMDVLEARNKAQRTRNQ